MAELSREREMAKLGRRFANISEKRATKLTYVRNVLFHVINVCEKRFISRN